MRHHHKSVKKVTTAFVLGAGLGTRLKPLTDKCPKPLLQIGGRPIITYAFDHLIQAGVERIIVNTHHLHHVYEDVFPTKEWKNVPLTFRHESPEILETGGGIRNILDLVEHEEHLLVYNGDIITNLPIGTLLEHHFQTQAEATLTLRSQDGPLHINTDEQGTIVDIRHQLNRPSVHDCLFACIYVLKTKLISQIPPNTKISIIPTFLDMLKHHERIESIIINEGSWSDIGTHQEFERVSKAYEKTSPQ